MTRKIIIDSDPGIDDAIALTMALFDPRLDVLAITATAGTVDAEQATSNVGAIISTLDPPRYPRVGKASPPEDASVTDDSFLNGRSGLGDFEVANNARQHLPASEKVMAELLRAHPGEVTIVCLGPLTNLARLAQRDPAALQLVDKLVISGGAYRAPGNASPVAEFNLHFDAVAAADVFLSPTTKSLVPLDVTNRIAFGVDLLEQLPAKYTRAGNLLGQMLPHAFRMSHQRLGRELLPLIDATTIAAVLEPELFEWTEMAGKVETQGVHTCGMSVFDRRLRPEWQTNMEVALKADVDGVQQLIHRSLKYAGQQT
ncbi:nucleoside hydrolase [Rhodopirellula sp. MGV]|uniref:nucleoside hydrolase n=1 Tax=Rhodopirellula sp. MGV TaxID=2023130 RepID=UPI000B9638C9|nr:nucleoside hydrolase [Rhodopirellula sp. MGV]OYP34440.1 nucleoside hydrolase [Rhodopirellula sp. MGV]PNY37384.1 nucleoside hydrolase [Rhodopirellula baltica]